MMEFTPRELATVLASLQFFQAELIRDEVQGGDGPISPHFEQHEPLSVAEIEALCGRLANDFDPAEPCDCEHAGYYCSGQPGIIARMENGRLAVDAVAQRCDQCQRYPSDAAALAKLREMGLA